MACSKSKSCKVSGKDTDCCWHDCKEVKYNTSMDIKFKSVWETDCAYYATYVSCVFW